MTDSWSDPRALRDVQYATDTSLAARQSIYAYQHPRVDLDAGEALLAAEFEQVTREEVTGQLDLPDATPLEAYARSLQSAPPADLPPGPYRIRTHTGVLVASA